MLTPERALGRAASWTMPDPDTIPQIQIGDAIYQGTAVLARVTDAEGRWVAETGSGRARASGTFFHLIAEDMR